MYNLKLLKYPTGVTRLVVYEYGVREDIDNDPGYMYSQFDECMVPKKTFLSPAIDQDRIQHSFFESMRRTKSMVYDYSLSNNWDWFITLTFDGSKVDRYDYDSCVHALRMFLQLVRRRCPKLRYLIVPEQHKDGAFHFHGLLASCDGLSFVDSGVLQGNRRVYNIPGFKYGFSTATKISDSCSAGTYLTKYITKELCSVSLGRKRYWASKNLQLPVRDTLAVDLDGNREKLLDNLYNLSRYYKKSVSQDLERVSYFFEFDPEIDMDIELFDKFSFGGESDA